MKNKIRTRRASRWTLVHGGRIRPPEAPLDPILVAAFEEVEPPAFRDHARSAIEAADVDLLDTIGGE
jgi:hypothetical protein